MYIANKADSGLLNGSSSFGHRGCPKRQTLFLCLDMSFLHLNKYYT